MRTALCMAISLAAVAGVVPPSSAQGSGVHGAPSATELKAEERQSHQGPKSDTGISLAVPTGKVTVGPKSLDGEPIYVRRTTVREGMTIVEVSTTPFMPVLASAEAPPAPRPDQPAGW